MSNKWRVKRGSASIQDIAVKDRDGNLVTNLDTASTIVFQIKTSRTAASALIEKTKGAGIEVDTPSQGYLRITLTATDTAQTIDDYYMALEIDWGSGVKYECILKISGVETEAFEIRQDTIQ